MNEYWDSLPECGEIYWTLKYESDTKEVIWHSPKGDFRLTKDDPIFLFIGNSLQSNIHIDKVEIREK